MKVYGNKRVSADVLRSLMHGVPRHEGCKRVAQFIRLGLESKKFTANEISYPDLGVVLGAIDPVDRESSAGRLRRDALNTEEFASEAQMDGFIFTEANAAVTTHTFQVVTGELIGSKIIEGYTATESIADQLVETMPTRVRNQKLAGFRHLGGSTEVFEGHPYEETGFEDKFVTTKESKRGRILSLTEELLFFDQTGEINRRARMLGEVIRDDRERTMVRGVIDADSATDPVYRPAGVGETLYNTDGSNYNYVGSGNTTSTDFNTAVTLQDWTDINQVLTYRATQVKDDRLDGDPRPLGSINAGGLILLVPEALRSTADNIFMQTRGEKITNSGVDVTHFPSSPIKARISAVLSSPYVDEVSDEDWYIGQFRKQFVWSEIWPLQVATQGRDSEAAFERDVVMRFKARYYGGLSAVDTPWVTAVDGG